MTPHPFPHFIGLVGYPESGKSHVQRILSSKYAVEPIDDGRPLRDAAKMWFGLTEEQVTTQKGKAETVYVAGKPWTVRDILGTIGKRLEETFGEQVIPTMSIQSVLSSEDYDDRRLYSFGSVRKTQGLTYRKWGGVIIEVRCDGTAPVYDFDHYDITLVDYVINNGSVHNRASWQSIESQIDAIMEPVLNQRRSFLRSRGSFDVVG